MFGFSRLDQIEHDIKRLKEENSAQIALIRTLSREITRLKHCNKDLLQNMSRIEKAKFFHDSIVSSQSSS
jgi:cell division septum initiation protein DivIVA